VNAYPAASHKIVVIRQQREVRQGEDYIHGVVNEQLASLFKDRLFLLKAALLSRAGLRPAARKNLRRAKFLELLNAVRPDIPSARLEAMMADATLFRQAFSRIHAVQVMGAEFYATQRAPRTRSCAEKKRLSSRTRFGELAKHSNLRAPPRPLRLCVQFPQPPLHGFGSVDDRQPGRLSIRSQAGRLRY